MWTTLLLLLSCKPVPPAAPTSPDLGLSIPGPPVWPERTVLLTPPDLVAPEHFATRRIVLDPGHGTGDNTGTETVFCEDEADVMLDLSEDLADHLRATGLFEVRLTREDASGPSYSRRVEGADDWQAEALVSLHLDARGRVWSWRTPTAEQCWRNDDSDGFAILVADRGEPELVERRLRLARSLASALGAAGFAPYSGEHYGGLYDLDPTPGVFLDRRVLYMLRRPTMPSVIVETFHGLNYEERTRFSEARTRAAFAAALGAGLVDALADSP